MKKKTDWRNVQTPTIKLEKLSLQLGVSVELLQEAAVWYFLEASGSKQLRLLADYLKWRSQLAEYEQEQEKEQDHGERLSCYQEPERLDAFNPC